jgi:hypothetical protein
LELQVVRLALESRIDRTSEIALKLGVETALDRDMQEVKQDIAPDAVLDEIEKKTEH